LARNGSGTYNLPAGAAVVTGTTITKTWWDTSSSDIAAALTGSLAANGETPVTADLPMGTYKHTGVGNASARNQYAAVGQVQDGSFIWCGTAGGTANAITLTPTPAITAYAAGQTFIFKAGANSSSSTITFAISGLSTIAGQVNFAACTNADIVANKLYSITLDTTSTAQINQLGNISGTFTPAITLGGGNTGITYAGRSATFSKNGNVVNFAVLIQLSSKGSSTGALAVTGMPFSANGSGLDIYPIFGTNITTATAMFGLQSGTTIAIYRFVSGSSPATILDSDLVDTSYIYFTGAYQV